MRDRPPPTSVPRLPTRYDAPGAFAARGWIVLAVCGALILAITAVAVALDGPPRRCLEPRVSVEWWQGGRWEQVRRVERVTCDRWAP